MTAGEQEPAAGKPRALKHTIFDSMLGTGAMTVITLVTGVLLSRLLGPEGRGIYGSATFWASFSYFILTFSFFDAALIHIRARRIGALEYLPSMLVMGVAMTVLAAIVGAAAVLGGLVDVHDLARPALLAFLVAHFASAVFHSAFITVEMSQLRFSTMNIERVGTPFLLMLAVAVLFVLGEDSIELLLAIFVLVKLPIVVRHLRVFRRDMIGPVNRPALEQTVGQGWRMFLSRGALGLASDADRLVLVSLWPARMLGNYFVAMSACGAALSLAGQAVQTILLPTLVGLEREEKRQKLEQVFRLGVLVGAGVVLAIWVTAPFLMPLVFGAEFTDSVGYVRGLVFASVFKFQLQILAIAHWSEEKSMPGVWTALGFLVTFALGFLVTGFDDATQFFIVLGLANLVSLAVSMAFLVRSGLLAIGPGLLPRWSDVTMLTAALWHYAQVILRRRAA